jgi:hypothetical protein
MGNDAGMIFMSLNSPLDDVQSSDHRAVRMSRKGWMLKLRQAKERRARILSGDDWTWTEMALRKNMQKLLDSPHTQIQAPQPLIPKLSGPAISAMRTLWAVPTKATHEMATPKESELRLRTAVVQACTSIKPGFTGHLEHDMDKKGMDYDRHRYAWFWR